MHVPHTSLLNLLEHTTRHEVERKVGERGTKTRENAETERKRSYKKWERKKRIN